MPPREVERLTAELDAAMADFRERRLAKPLDPVGRVYWTTPGQRGLQMFHLAATRPLRASAQTRPRPTPRAATPRRRRALRGSGERARAPDPSPSRPNTQVAGVRR